MSFICHFFMLRVLNTNFLSGDLDKWSVNLINTIICITWVINCSVFARKPSQFEPWLVFKFRYLLEQSGHNTVAEFGAVD
jgi:hypothetical protein